MCVGCGRGGGLTVPTALAPSQWEVRIFVLLSLIRGRSDAEGPPSWLRRLAAAVNLTSQVCVHALEEGVMLSATVGFFETRTISIATSPDTHRLSEACSHVPISSLRRSLTQMRCWRPPFITLQSKLASPRYSADRRLALCSQVYQV